MPRRIFTVPSLAETVPEELQALHSRTARERAWYTGYTVYSTNEDILASARRGKLSILNPGKDLIPIGRLRNPELFHLFPPYLLPDSRMALMAVGRLWRTRLQAEVIDLPRMVLSVTSLIRSDEVQQDLVRRGKLAETDSTHRAGAAFDIDASAYYENDPTLGYVPIVHPERSQSGMRQAADVLKGEVVEHGYEAPEASTSYDPQIPAALLAVTQELHDSGLINLIVEFVNQPNQCVHIAPNPDVDWPALISLDQV